MAERFDMMLRRCLDAERSHDYRRLPALYRRLRILNALSDGNMWTAAELAVVARCGVRTVWRHVHALRDDGYPVISGSGAGYMLRPQHRSLPPAALPAAEAAQARPPDS